MTDGFERQYIFRAYNVVSIFFGTDFILYFFFLNFAEFVLNFFAPNIFALYFGEEWWSIRLQYILKFAPIHTRAIPSRPILRIFLLLIIHIVTKFETIFFFLIEWAHITGNIFYRWNILHIFKYSPCNIRIVFTLFCTL